MVNAFRNSRWNLFCKIATLYLLSKRLKNTYKKVPFFVKLQVGDLRLYKSVYFHSYFSKFPQHKFRVATFKRSFLKNTCFIGQLSMAASFFIIQKFSLTITISTERKKYLHLIGKTKCKVTSETKRIFCKITAPFSQNKSCGYCSKLAATCSVLQKFAIIISDFS